MALLGRSGGRRGLHLYTWLESTPNLVCPLQAVTVPSSVRWIIDLVTEPERDPRPKADAASPEGRVQPTEAQREYDDDPVLRELLTRAAASPTIRSARRHVDDRATE